MFDVLVDKLDLDTLSDGIPEILFGKLVDFEKKINRRNPSKDERGSIFVCSGNSCLLF